MLTTFHHCFHLSSFCCTFCNRLHSLCIFNFSCLLDPQMSFLHPFFVDLWIFLIIDQLSRFILDSMRFTIFINNHLNVSFLLCIPLQLVFLFQKLLWVIREQIYSQFIQIKLFRFIPECRFVF